MNKVVHTVIISIKFVIELCVIQEHQYLWTSPEEASILTAKMTKIKIAMRERIKRSHEMGNIYRLYEKYLLT